MLNTKLPAAKHVVPLEAAAHGDRVAMLQPRRCSIPLALGALPGGRALELAGRLHPRRSCGGGVVTDAGLHFSSFKHGAPGLKSKSVPDFT